jgi:FixJ family two-component response regulator
LALVVVAKANKDVANVLGVSDVTVKAHSGSVMQKMGAGSLAELANQAA